MTLTHLIPSLRRTLPDPLSRDLWPEFTTATTTDVAIAGVSVTRLVEWCGTPCVHTAAAVIPGSGGRPSPTELASVVASRIESVTRSHSGVMEVRVDALLDHCAALLTETRLIGRASTAHDVEMNLMTGHDADARTVRLPLDVQVGDLLVVPCLGVTALRQLHTN